MTGTIASTAAAVAGRWYSNHQAYTGAIPNVLLKAVRDAAGTLVQGKWNVGEQFVYATAHTPSGKQSLFVARFREVFAVAGLVYDDLEPPEVEGFSSRATWIPALRCLALVQTSLSRPRCCAS